MKVIAIEPHPDHVLVVIVEGESTDQPRIVYYDTLSAGTDQRGEGLGAIRTRVHGLVREQKPDVVVVKPLENAALQPASKRNISMKWFETAEVRGVALEATEACGIAPELRDGATVTRTIGTRKGKDYKEDDDFWKSDVDGALSNKKYRAPALMAISALRERLE